MSTITAKRDSAFMSRKELEARHQASIERECKVDAYATQLRLDATYQVVLDALDNAMPDNVEGRALQRTLEYLVSHADESIDIDVRINKALDWLSDKDYEARSKGEDTRQIQDIMVLLTCKQFDLGRLICRQVEKYCRSLADDKVE